MRKLATAYLHVLNLHHLGLVLALLYQQRLDQTDTIQTDITIIQRSGKIPLSL